VTDTITVYGASWCPDCRRAKQFFGEHRIDYEWIDITENAEAVAFVEKVNNGGRRIPTIVFPDGDILVEPSNAELMAKTEAQTELGSAFFDLIVVGGGPSGLTAAIYAAREGLKTLVIDQAGLGGQAATTQILDNFPGFAQGINGQEFAQRLELQARRFKTQIVQGEQIVDIVRDGQYLVVKSINRREYVSHAVLIATGSRYMRLNIPGEDELIGYNVHFCATCDGPFYKGKDVLVIGGGNSGFEEGLHLATMARSVTIVEFNSEVKASQILQEKVAERESMRVVTNHAVLEFKVKDDNQLAGVIVEDRATGEVKEWHPDGVFVFIGLSPNSSFLATTIERDQWGFIKTDATLQTSLAGVFAAGDVREGSTKQAISAAGEGATAALMIRQYLKSLGDVNPVNSIEREMGEVMWSARCVEI
jgi:thioredoxin reductase (NADPH)